MALLHHTHDFASSSHGMVRLNWRLLVAVAASAAFWLLLARIFLNL